MKETKDLITFYQEMFIKQNKETSKEKLIANVINEIMLDIYIGNINVLDYILEQHNLNLQQHGVDLAKYLNSK